MAEILLPHDLFHDPDKDIVQCVVPVSGGKDSQVTLELAIKEFGADNIRGLFCDTQYEHPITYEHVKWMRQHYGVRIDVVTGGSVIDKTLKYGRWPGGGSRHCTDELKIRETRIYLKALAEAQGIGFQVWYGMRLEEGTERRKRYADKLDTELYPPHEVLPRKYPKYLAKMGVMFRLPILEWSTSEVFDFLDGRHNILYNKYTDIHGKQQEGFSRVGCFPCQAAGDGTKEKAFSYDNFGQAQYARAMEISKQIGKSVWTSKGGKARNEGPGCAVCAI